MSHFLYTRLQTPLQRLVAVFIGGVSILLALRFSAGTVWQGRIAAIAPAGMAIILLIRFWRRWQTIRYGLMRWQVRMIRSWRAYSTKPPTVEALHLLGIAMSFLSVAGLVSGLYSDVRIGMMPAFSVFVVAGICEITVQTKRVLKQAWAKLVGKIISLSLGVMLTAVTVSMAKQTVHSLAHVDPKYLTEFTAVAAAGLMPLMYLGAAGVVLLLWAMIQTLLLGAVFVGTGLLSQAKPFIGEGVQQRMRLFWYRIRIGRRPPGGVVPTAGFMPQHEVSLVGSVLSKLAVVCLLVQAGEGVAVAVPDVTPLLIKAMVRLEFRAASSCRNVDAGLGVVYIDRGNVLVARPQNGHYLFTVEKCEY